MKKVIILSVFGMYFCGQVAAIAPGPIELGVKFTTRGYSKGVRGFGSRRHVKCPQPSPSIEVSGYGIWDVE